MALTPPPLTELLGQLKSLAEDSSFKQDFDKNSKALAQSLLTKLDLVSREEFDAQKALLIRAQERISELELKLEQLEQNSD